MRIIGSLLCLFLLAGAASAQTDSEPATSEQQVKTAYIKFHVDKPVQSIQSIQIKDTGEQLESVVSDNGQYVTVLGLDSKRRLVVDVTYQDGTSETIEKSPCVLFEEYAL